MKNEFVLNVEVFDMVFFVGCVEVFVQVIGQQVEVCVGDQIFVLLFDGFQMQFIGIDFQIFCFIYFVYLECVIVLCDFVLVQILLLLMVFSIVEVFQGGCFVQW